MKQSTNSMRGWPWLLLLVLFAWLLPQEAAAELSYEDDPDNYVVELGGSNVIYFTAPCYDTSGADTWIQDGNLRVSVEGADPVTIFTWKSETDINNSNTTLKVNFSTTADGFFDITLGNTRNTFRLTKSNGGNQSVVRNSDGKTFGFSAEWAVPYNLLGKKLRFSWHVIRNGNSATVLEREVPGLQSKDISMPAASVKREPFVSLPMLSANNPGKLEVPWFMASDSIVSAHYEYTDDAGKHHEHKIENVKGGTILLDANVPYRNFRVVCSYKEPSDKGSYLIEGQGSAVQNIPLIHTPVGMTVRQLDGQDLKVEVKWNIAYPDDEDLTPTDFFEVQRSITGEEKDFVTVNQVPYISVNKQSTFTFVDNTLMDDITPDMLVNGGTLDKLTYRVRRTITQDWNWAKNSCYSSVRSVVDRLHLLRIANYSAKWEDERAYTVRVSWDYADEHGAVWDERAQMVLRVAMKNRDGQPVDTLVYTLDQNDRAQRYKIVSLSRSCVDYDIDMYVERGESPLNFLEQTEDYFFPIHNVNDWTTFRDKVQAAKGQYDVNARLYADISIENSVGLYETYPYRGTFDGNGHTLNVNISGGSLNSIAIFRFVDNATFSDLHITGNINTNQMYAGSLIGRIQNGHSVIIENCRSSITLNNSINGDATMGGFVGLVGDNGSVSFRNCKFDGFFDGANCSHIGGFIGCCLENTTETIENCLFAPASINTKPDGCQTWVRKYNSSILTIVNSYATRDFTALVVIRTANDWTTFRDMVEKAKGQYDVNAILAADVNVGDISIGWSTSFAYRGTFDGNGHTLTFNRPDFSEKFIAPFRHAGNATFKNLRVAGTIASSQMYPAGIVAQVINGTATFENCHSSVTLKGTMNGEGTLGGFVGRVSESKVTIRNCKFDGNFEGTNCYGNGGFISWVDEKSSATIVNCFFTPASVTTDPKSSETWARQDSRGTVTVSNSYATKEFCHVINNFSDWEEFRNAVAGRGSHSVNAILNADISANTSILNFKGVFDGNAHTIDMGCTMFNSASDYTIKNLHVKGAYSGDQHIAGLVTSSWNANIQSCWVSTAIHCNTTHAGGFIGHAQDSPHTINNCLFDGAISTKDDGKNDGTSYVGAFIGWGGGADNYVTNCLEDGYYPYADHAGFSYKGNGDAWGNTGNSKNNYTYKGVSWNEVNYAGITHGNVSEVVKKLGSDWWYVDGNNALPKMSRRELWNNVGSLSASDLAKNLGSGWKVDGNKAVPVMSSSTIGYTEEELEQYFTFGWTKEGDKLVPATTTVEENVYAEITKPTLPNFYHKNTGTIDPVLVTTTRQSSVLLAWNTDGNPIDYFTVMRRVKGEGDGAWKEVETNIDQMSYEDTSVSPLAVYEYKVLAVNDCEGITTTETQVKQGECKHTGRVDGYVRFNDGSSATGIQVDIIDKDNHTVMSVFTDDSGYFVADELSYQGGTSVTYKVAPVVSGNNEIKLEKDDYYVTFNATSNNETIQEFIIKNGNRFSGYVMYEGTSIPVKGANFLVNGKKVHDVKGNALETDYDGSFSFRVLPGKNTIQAVMDGHVFTSEGYFKGAEGHNFTGDVAGIYFYDATKVKLAGRVVGGEEQGQKPLGNNLSTNNLGDSLTIVLTLEGDNTSWLVYDNLNPNKSQREEVVRHQRNGNKHYTSVKTERKRMTVWPDPTTGEYELMLPPVRWKVQQVYCKGYPTLFQERQVSEVVDLTDCLTPKDTTYVGSYKDIDSLTVKDPALTYNAIYNRIYRAPVEVTYKQLGYDTFDYFGDKNYYATQLTGETVEVPLAYQKTEGYTAYENPFDKYTHTPTLTPQDAIHTAFFSEEYDKLFDGKPSTKWCSTSGSDGWWVTFKVNQLVSLKTLHLTTGKDTKTYSERNPKAMRLLGRATESDEWKVLMETADAGMGAENLKTYDFDVPNHSFCQFFRLEISSVSNGNILQLGELSLTCRGNADSDPADDHDPDPILAGQATYTFGHPVFSVERKYTIELQVGENYPYNNDPAGKVDIVRLGGGMAMMQNGLKPGSYDEPVEIDDLGRARFTLTAGQTSVLLTDKSALKTVTFTVMRDGTFLEAAPLRGYVLNMFPVGDSKDIMTEGEPILFDILRDPPGAYSTNTLAKGATLNYTYMMNLTLTAGLSIWYKTGKELQTIEAAVQAPEGIGIALGSLSAGKVEEGTINELMYNAQGSKAFSYTMVVGNNISTSGDPSMVGADADLYIGAVQNVVVTPMSTIRAVNKKMYERMAARQGGINKASEVAQNVSYGTVVKIAEGFDAKGDTIYLIRDVALGYGPKINSQFIYSQKQILTEIIPAKAREIVDMMFCGTKAEAQAIADRTGKPVYWSLRDSTDAKFAVVNKRLEGHAYNDYIDKAEDGINYMVVRPTGTSSDQFKDEVTERYQILKDWTDMIAQNEMEKLRATDLLTNYDIAGAQGVNYSETYQSDYQESFTHHFPVATEVDYFGPGISYAASALSIGGTIIGSFLASMSAMKGWTQPNATPTYTEAGDFANMTYSGDLLQWRVLPVAIYGTVGANSEAKSYNRTESFTIATDPMSRLNVDVYRVKPLFANSGTEMHNMINPRMTSNDSVAFTNIFSNYQFDKLSDLVTDFVGKSLKEQDIIGPRGFVFRTRGGATQNPWEDKRTTVFYDTGRTLDERTLKIVNPKIRLDKQSVSGVSINDAAHFKVYVSNESEKPEATEDLTVLQLFAADQLNPNGAKISVNGQTLTTGGMTISVVPGKETELDMEVRAGQGFDFMGLTIGVMSPTDANNTTELVSFNVHFLREAGPVNIATPGDKWVLNTMAQMDSKRGWYIPVTINGFNRHQQNFDHIEFQYKESQRGDDSWTNLCSYYADPTLMANANGVRELIPENGNIVTQFFGEGWVMERTYDLRAVLYCRNGSDFLTTPSKVISGIKDTRRPQLFGTPEPKSGLLTSIDDIVFNFSEDIEYNYLSAITNFEVKGEVNNDNLSEMVSVQFAGQSSVESEAKRNFSGKDLTIDMRVKPAETGRDMPLFSHGTNGQKLQLWLTKDFKLKAVVNEQEFESNSEIGKNAFRQVALVINQTDSLLKFFYGGVEIGRHKLTSLYNGTGTLIFGRTNELNRAQSQYYEGRMMEARLWYSAMDGALIGTTYGGKRLTGYESNLVDYYPMNEGSGDYVTDHTQGANAKLMGASWAIPRGLSLHLEKADKGVLLDKNAINRTNEHDYTLMFWFKTDADGRGALLSNGRGLKEDIGAQNLYHIGFEGDKLMYRSNGFATEVPGDWSDGQWHNFAMTVNRARNVANIYVDKELRTTFETDSLGGISGGYPLIGATRYDVLKENGDVETKDGTDALKGNVDEVLFFAQALPQQLINTYATKSPNGDESGLLTYLSFDRIERQKDNDLELVPYAYSKKIYLDEKGQPRYQLDPLTKEPTNTLVRDYLFVDEMDAVLTHFDQTQAAPVLPYEEVKNLKFGFIGRGNQLLVELDEPAAKLNRRNIYVTVRDIEDKNGNTMASPQTACYYVTNSSLQWVVNRLDATIKYGSTQSTELAFYNWSASNHTYTIENCPKWLTLNKYTDVVAPQSLDYVIATASKDLNIGTYNDIIYLTDEEGITEPFYLNLTVEGDQPDWAQSIDRDLLKNSMSITGQVYLYNELDTDSRDIIGVFDNENVCHGYANISHSEQTGETGLYLTVYDKETKGRQLSFRLWQYSTGREIVLTPEKTITFEKDAILGTDKPVRFDGGEDFVQYFRLEKGWNWVSFNISEKEPEKVSALLTSLPWKNGDIMTDLSSDLTLTFKDNLWYSSDNPEDMALSPKMAYAIKVQQPIVIPIAGTVIKDVDERTIDVKQGWNGIGYTPALNLSVETALSDYYDNAQTGDVIKSHTEFAYFTKTGNSGRWRGNLQYMKPGEGYMLLRKGEGNVSFTYPFYEPGSTFLFDTANATRKAAQARRASAADSNAGSDARNYRYTMNVCAVAEGFSVEEGDLVVAYTDGEPCGMAMVVSGETADHELGETADHEPGETADHELLGRELLYLSIGGSRSAQSVSSGNSGSAQSVSSGNIYFAIERGGDIVALSSEQMTFRANAIVGTPDEPFAIRFADATGIKEIDDLAGFEAGEWYTVNGVKLAEKPTRPGLYIYNNSKVVIKKK